MQSVLVTLRKLIKVERNVCNTVWGHEGKDDAEIRTKKLSKILILLGFWYIDIHFFFQYHSSLFQNKY